jgi:thioredoxin-related protein
MTLRTLRNLCLVLVVLGGIAAHAESWDDNFEKVKKDAARKELPILMLFTGTDWCPWCVKLENEVFSENEFKRYARKNLVTFIADFPRRKSLSKKTTKQNKELAATYGVKGFPTVVLVDAEGKEIARTGYKEGGAEAYVEHLKELLKDVAKPEKKEDSKTK